MTPRLVLLDFDHTLFDTDRFFWEDVRQAVLDLGIDPQRWEDAYEAVWPTGYSLAKHLKDLGASPAGAARALEVLRRRFRDLRPYLFPDVLPFLERARARGTGLILLSFGDPGWQAFKVGGAGIGPYFRSVLTTRSENSKAEALASVADGAGTLAAVDNSPAELDAMRERCPSLRTYLINRVPPDRGEAPTAAFREARRYLRLPARFPHVPCRTLDEVSA